MNENNQQGHGFTVEEIGEHFGRLLGQMFAMEITLTKQQAKLRAENARLSTENEGLRERLHKAELNVLAAQGNAIIESAKEKAAY